MYLQTHIETTLFKQQHQHQHPCIWFPKQHPHTRRSAAVTSRFQVVAQFRWEHQRMPRILMFLSSLERARPSSNTSFLLSLRFSSVSPNAPLAGVAPQPCVLFLVEELDCSLILRDVIGQIQHKTNQHTGSTWSITEDCLTKRLLQDSQCVGHCIVGEQTLFKMFQLWKNLNEYAGITCDKDKHPSSPLLLVLMMFKLLLRLFLAFLTTLFIMHVFLCL